VTPGTAIVLLGFGIGALVVAGRAEPRGVVRPQDRPEELRDRAIEAQVRAATASREARELTARWSSAAQTEDRKNS